MKGGNKNAFLNIYHENYNILFSYGFSLTCDKELTKDCIQEMFLEIWNTRVSINKDVQNVRSYLCTWLRRKISRIQSRIIKERSFEEFSDNFEHNEPSYEEMLIAFQETEEKKEKLTRAWYHGVVTYKAGKMDFYVNGDLVKSWTNTPHNPITLANPINFVIGQDLPTNKYLTVDGDF